MLLSDGFTVLDTETTGPEPTRDRIIQIGLVLFRAGVAVSRASRIVNPGVEWRRDRYVVMGHDGVGITVPLGAFEVHNIATKDLLSKPNFEHVWPKARITPPTVGYNTLGFDFPLIRAECQRTGLSTAAIDTMHVDLYPFIQWHFRGFRIRKLGDVAAKFGIRASGAGLHDALADCEITGLLLMKLVQLGIVPDDPEKAAELSQILRAAVEQEFERFMYWFYEDRTDGALRMGCGRYTGKLIADVPKKEWKKLHTKATDAPPRIRAMLKEFSQDDPP